MVGAGDVRGMGGKAAQESEGGRGIGLTGGWAGTSLEYLGIHHEEVPRAEGQREVGLGMVPPARHGQPAERAPPHASGAEGVEDLSRFAEGDVAVPVERTPQGSVSAVEC